MSHDCCEKVRVAVIGGYGVFGGRVAAVLARQGVPLIVAGRNEARARRFVGELAGRCAPVLPVAARLDGDDANLDRALTGLSVGVVVNAAGPFHRHGYRVARAAIAAGCHYVDLADDRAHVAGIASLDAPARRAGVCVLSGASSVPGLSSVAIDTLARDLDGIDTIDIAIVPGNRSPRGDATVEAVLRQNGRPFFQWRDGRWQRAFGWQSLTRWRFPGIGARWLAACDVPDQALLPGRYPGVDRVSFRAGLELRSLHIALWLMSGLARAGLVRDWSAHAGWIGAVARRFENLGTGTGAMQCRVRGRRNDGALVERHWTLVARDGHGPFVPALPAAIVARRLAGPSPPAPGARPALGLFDLAAFTAAADGLTIEHGIEERIIDGKSPHPARL